MELTQKLLKELFDYKDGFLFWKKGGHGKKVGDKAGTLNKRKNGDRYVIGVGFKKYLSSRLIFLWNKGFLPEFVDHEDRDGQNDRIENLRASTRSQNNCNKKPSKNGTSEYLGVKKINNSFVAQIKSNKKVIYLGTFKTEELAAIAYNKAAIKHHGNFANINIIKNGLV